MTLVTSYDTVIAEWRDARLNEWTMRFAIQDFQRLRVQTVSMVPEPVTTPADMRFYVVLATDEPEAGRARSVNWVDNAADEQALATRTAINATLLLRVFHRRELMADGYEYGCTVTLSPNPGSPIWKNRTMPVEHPTFFIGWKVIQ